MTNQTIIYLPCGDRKLDRLGWKSLQEWLLSRLKALNDQLNEQNQGHVRRLQLVYHRTLLTYHNIWQIKLLYTYPVGNLSLSALSLLKGAWFCSLNLSLSAWFGLWCLTPISTIFQLYRGGCTVVTNAG
jgi:hypothetical protein